jgi:hypothetical protein
MRTNTKYRKIILGLVVLLALSFIILSVIFMKNMYNDYNLVDKNVKFNGSVSDFMLNRGGIYIQLSDGSKIILKPSRNYIYDPPFQDKFIRIGDTLFNKSGSDTICIVRDKQVYFFRNVVDINKKE